MISDVEMNDWRDRVLKLARNSDDVVVGEIADIALMLIAELHEWRPVLASVETVIRKRREEDENARKVAAMAACAEAAKDLSGAEFFRLFIADEELPF